MIELEMPEVAEARVDTSLRVILRREHRRSARFMEAKLRPDIEQWLHDHDLPFEMKYDFEPGDVEGWTMKPIIVFETTADAMWFKFRWY